jgi:hypothetical protein
VRPRDIRSHDEAIGALHSSWNRDPQPVEDLLNRDVTRQPAADQSRHVAAERPDELGSRDRLVLREHDEGNDGQPRAVEREGVVRSPRAAGHGERLRRGVRVGGHAQDENVRQLRHADAGRRADAGRTVNQDDVVVLLPARPAAL